MLLELLSRSWFKRTFLTLSSSDPWMNFDNFPKAWLSRFDLKLFAFNNINNNLPNLWYFYKNNLDPDIIEIDEQHISFTIKLHGVLLGFSVIYASTNCITIRHLSLKLSNVIPNIPWYFIRDFNAIVSADEHKDNHFPAITPITGFFQLV